MLVAWVNESEIVPFDSVEFVEDVSENAVLQLDVHMTTSGKTMRLVENHAKSFLKEYQAYLQTISDTLQNVGYEQ